MAQGLRLHLQHPCVHSQCVFSHCSHVQLFETMDRSPLGSSVHRILQTRILEWGLPCSPSGDLPNSGIEPESPAAPAPQVDSSPLNHWGSPSTSVLSVNIQGWLPLGLTGGISLLSFGWKNSCSLWFFILHWDDFYLVEPFPVCKK